MVAINDQHDHGDGEMCEGCRFKAALASFLDEGLGGGNEESWLTAVLELRDAIKHAAQLLEVIWDIETNSRMPQPGKPEAAAEAIVCLHQTIDSLREQLL